MDVKQAASLFFCALCNSLEGVSDWLYFLDNLHIILLTATKSRWSASKILIGSYSFLLIGYLDLSFDPT